MRIDNLRAGFECGQKSEITIDNLSIVQKSDLELRIEQLETKIIELETKIEK